MDTQKTINSTDVFNYMRPKFGLKQTQVDALYKILEDVDINLVAQFIGMENMVVKEENPTVNKNFKFSQKSLDRMKGVDGNLITVIKDALNFSEVDFAITEGLRTLARQKELVKQGASQTLNSNHMKGEAIDLVAYTEDGKITWDWEYYLKIAEAVRLSAIKHNVKVRWGSAWGRYLNDYPSAKSAYDAYIKDRKDKGKKPFIDAVHFEVS